MSATHTHTSVISTFCFVPVTSRHCLRFSDMPLYQDMFTLCLLTEILGVTNGVSCQQKKFACIKLLIEEWPSVSDLLVTLNLARFDLLWHVLPVNLLLIMCIVQWITSMWFSLWLSGSSRDGHTMRKWQPSHTLPLPSESSSEVTRGQPGEKPRHLT